METTTPQIPIPDEHRQPHRRRYEEAFDPSTGNVGEDDDDEEHIVPQPTIPLGTEHEETQRYPQLIHPSKLHSNFASFNRDKDASSSKGDDRVSCDVPFCCSTF